MTNRRTSLYFAVCYIAAICPSQKTMAAVVVADSTRTLTSVTVSEQAPSQAVTSTTPHHTVLSESFTQMGITDMADALHRLPGITLRDYGGAGGMKTVAVRGLGTQHTGVSMDGVVVSNCQSSEVDLSRYSIGDMQAVSLHIGLSDDIFQPARQAAFPALLSLLTISPEIDSTSLHTTARVTTGSFGYLQPYLRLQRNFNQRLAITASAHYTRADNQYPFTLHNVQLVTHEHRRHNSLETGQIDLGMLWRLARGQMMRGKIYYYDSRRDLPGQVHYYTNISRETLREREAFAQIHYEIHLQQRLSIKASAKGTWNCAAYQDPLYKAGTNDGTYFQREAYVTSTLLYRPTPHFSASYAADYAFNNLNSSLTTDSRPRRRTLLQAVSAQLRTSRLLATAQLLGSLYWNSAKEGSSASDYSRLSPALSVSFRLLSDYSLFFRASYKDIFRLPSFNEYYFFHYGSPDVQPERTSHWNVGLTWAERLGRAWHVQFTADGYLNQVRDKIVAVPRNLFVWQCINVGKVRVLGMDMTTDITWNANSLHTLILHGSYSLQQATNQTLKESPYYGYQLAYTPQHIGNMTISWNNPWVNVSLNGEGMSHRYSTNEHHDGTRISGYWEMGCTFWKEINICQHGLQLRADIKNILDQQYEIIRHYPMPGRSFLISLQYNF
ncbi:MAG: TonB-dependent receptor [Bacteroidaceae bacterium]|nr:TonB-dependent receptor [Bacteroidaceae bacterium]